MTNCVRQTLVSQRKYLLKRTSMALSYRKQSLAPIARKLDNAIHCIKLYTVDTLIHQRAIIPWVRKIDWVIAFDLAMCVKAKQIQWRLCFFRRFRVARMSYCRTRREWKLTWLLRINFVFLCFRRQPWGFFVCDTAAVSCILMVKDRCHHVWFKTSWTTTPLLKMATRVCTRF